MKVKPAIPPSRPNSSQQKLAVKCGVKAGPPLIIRRDY